MYTAHIINAFSLFNGYPHSLQVLLQGFHFLIAASLFLIGFWIYKIRTQLKKRTEELAILNRSLEQRIAVKTQEYEKLSEFLLEKNNQLDHINSLLRKEITTRKEISDLLETNEEKYRNFISQSGDGIAITEEYGKIVEWNKKMEEITGFSQAEVINRYMWEIEFEILPITDRTPDRKESLRMKYQHPASDLKEPFTFEEKICNRNGELKTILSLIFPIVTKQENLIGCITRDITHEIYHKENELSAKLLQLVQNLVLVVDLEGRIIRFNDAYEKITGFSKEDLIHSCFWDIHYRDEQSLEIKKLFLENDKNKIPAEINGTIITRSGEQRKVLWKSNTLNDESGKITHLIYSGTDITEHLRREEALALSEYKFRQIFEKTLTGYILYEPIFDENSNLIDIRYVAANPAFQEQTGLNPEDMLGKTFREVFGDKETFFIEEYNIFKKTGRYINYEEYFERLNKYFRIQQFELLPGLMAISHDDVTELKRMEHKMIETVINIEERGHKRIARDLHDELGPQLASMNVYVSSLLRRIDQQEQIEILILLKTLIKDSIARVREISNNLTPQVIEKYGLTAAINTEIENMRLILPVNFVHQISQRFDPKLEISVYRIIKELLNNTKKYAQATKVSLEMKSNSKMLSIHYADDGIGFDPQENLINGSIGMGLLNIESRAKAIHGKFSIKSKPYKGFQFFMEVPVQISDER